MSTKQNTVSVSILDKEYKVVCPPEARNSLLTAAKALDDKMKEIRLTGKIYGTERIAVMAALNLTHELIQEGEKSTLFAATMATLHQKIDAAISS